jgi:hypothetical protein
MCVRVVIVVVVVVAVVLVLVLVLLLQLLLLLLPLLRTYSCCALRYPCAFCLTVKTIKLFSFTLPIPLP